jgi:hypothetical protein
MNKRVRIKTFSGYIMKNVAYIANNFINPLETRESNFNVKFNNLFLKLGYNVIVDLGEGAIQSNEPFQAAFLNVKAYKIIDKILNKSYKKT